MSKKYSSLGEVPNEILIEILLFSEIKDLLKVSLCNKKLFELSTSDVIWTNKKWVKGILDNDNLNFKELIISFFTNVLSDPSMDKDYYEVIDSLRDRVRIHNSITNASNLNAQPNNFGLNNIIAPNRYVGVEQFSFYLNNDAFSELFVMNIQENVRNRFVETKKEIYFMFYEINKVYNFLLDVDGLPTARICWNICCCLFPKKKAKLNNKFREHAKSYVSVYGTLNDEQKAKLNVAKEKTCIFTYVMIPLLFLTAIFLCLFLFSVGFLFPITINWIFYAIAIFVNLICVLPCCLSLIFTWYYDSCTLFKHYDKLNELRRFVKRLKRNNLVGKFNRVFKERSIRDLDVWYSYNLDWRFILGFTIAVLGFMMIIPLFLSFGIKAMIPQLPWYLCCFPFYLCTLLFCFVTCGLNCTSIFCWCNIDKYREKTKNFEGNSKWSDYRLDQLLMVLSIPGGIALVFLITCLFVSVQLIVCGIYYDIISLTTHWAIIFFFAPSFCFFCQFCISVPGLLLLSYFCVKRMEKSVEENNKNTIFGDLTMFIIATAGSTTLMAILCCPVLIFVILLVVFMIVGINLFYPFIVLLVTLLICCVVLPIGMVKVLKSELTRTSLLKRSGL